MHSLHRIRYVRTTVLWAHLRKTCVQYLLILQRFQGAPIDRLSDSKFAFIDPFVPSSSERPSLNKAERHTTAKVHIQNVLFG